MSSDDHLQSLHFDSFVLVSEFEMLTEKPIRILYGHCLEWLLNAEHTCKVFRLRMLLYVVAKLVRENKLLLQLLCLLLWDTRAFLRLPRRMLMAYGVWPIVYD